MNVQIELGLVGSIGLSLGVSLRVSRFRVRVIRWTLWHGGGTLNVGPKIPTFFLLYTICVYWNFADNLAQSGGDRRDRVCMCKVT